MAAFENKVDVFPYDVFMCVCFFFVVYIVCYLREDIDIYRYLFIYW